MKEEYFFTLRLKTSTTALDFWHLKAKDIE